MKIYKPIKAKAHTPPYKIHRYFARRPWNVFKQLIEIYSDEGDIVLDPFCGGGVTIYEGIKLSRKVVGFDLNPLSIFIVKNMVKKEYQRNHLSNLCKSILDYLEYLYGDYNKIIPDSNQKTLFEKRVPVEWSELAFKAICNYCGEEIILSNKNKIKNGRYSCKNSSCVGNKDNNGFVEPKNCKRTGYIYLCSVVKSPEKKGRLFIDFSEQDEDRINEHINFLENEIKLKGMEIPQDEIPLNWDRQHEDLLLRKNIVNFQDLFTKRNLLLNLLLLNYINEMEKNHELDQYTYEIIRLIFSSSLRDTNIMAFTNPRWQSGTPTTWSKHAYWIPSQFCEVDIISSFKRAFNRMMKALEYNEKFDYKVKQANYFSELKKGFNIILKDDSVASNMIPDNSVDAIITDPPYGSNVQYLELSSFWYPWNKDLYGNKNPDFSKEAVSNRKKNFDGAKSLKEYENNLYEVFKKSFDVLKYEKYLVLTFNNKDIGAWLALLISIFRSGFILEKDGLFFQSGVKNYRQTAHTKYEGSPYGDFIYVFKKTKEKRKMKQNYGEQSFIKDIDEHFDSYMDKFYHNNVDKNELIRKMILEIIPKIELFSHTNNSNHYIYENYKNHLKKIYSDKIGKKKRIKVNKRSGET